MNFSVQQDGHTSVAVLPEGQEAEDELEGVDVDAASESALDVSGSSESPMDMDQGPGGSSLSGPGPLAGSSPDLHHRKELESEKTILAKIHQKIHGRSHLTDNVFEDCPSAIGPAGGAGSGSPKGGSQAHPVAPVFPPTYNILRAGKLKKMATTRLPGAYTESIGFPLSVAGRLAGWSWRAT